MLLLASYGCTNTSGLQYVDSKSATAVVKDIGLCAKKKFEKCILPKAKENKIPPVPAAATNEELEEMAKRNQQ